MTRNLYHRIHVATHQGPVDASEGLAHMSSSSIGCVHVLVNRVPREKSGRKVSAVSYRLHGGITRDIVRGICEYACGYWPNTSYWVGVAEGRLNVGDQSLVIALAAPTVDLGLDAVNYLVRTIERRTPIWCRDHYLDGDSSEWAPIHAERPNPLMG